MGAVLVAAPMVVACSSSGGGSSNSGGGGGGGGKLPSTIHVALPLDLTGNLAAYGQQFKQGFDTALDAINSSNMLSGSKITASAKDTASTPATASSVVAQISQSNAVAMVGLDTSALALAAAPIAQKAGLPSLIDCAPDGLLDIGDHIYSVQTSQITVATPVAERVAKSGAKSVSIVYANDNPTLTSFWKALVPALKSNGVTVKESVGTPIAATDYSALITRVKGDNPDAIVLATAGPGALSLVQGLRSAGYKGTLFGHPGAGTPMAGAGSFANGFIFPTEWLPGVSNSSSKAFQTQMAKKFPSAQITNETVDGYNAAYFLAMAIQKSHDASKSGVLKGLQEVAKTGFSGPPGQMKFVGTGNRQIDAPTAFAEVQNGKFLLAPAI